MYKVDDTMTMLLFCRLILAQIRDREYQLIIPAWNAHLWKLSTAKLSMIIISFRVLNYEKASSEIVENKPFFMVHRFKWLIQSKLITSNRSMYWVSIAF